MVSPKLSLVVVSFNMARELPRTIRTLSPAMQRQIAACDYEILVMDNGSTEPFDSVQCAQWGENVTFHRVRDGGVSPCSAANAGIAVARGELIGVMADGARMASPGLLWSAMVAWRLHHRPIISTLGFHLGPAVQMKSVREGYDQQAEDRLLRSVDWQSDGYRLFEISVFARASRRGWFGRIGESNALFLPRGLWSELGGYEEKFVSPGGGLANMDVYRRACGLADSQLIVLLGEGTFHQIHGGTVTNSPSSRWKEFHDEYVRIRGYPFAPPAAQAWLFGRPDRAALPSIVASARRAISQK